MSPKKSTSQSFKDPYRLHNMFNIDNPIFCMTIYEL